MSRFTAYRTTATTLAGFLALLVLAMIAGKFSLPVEMVTGLAYAIVCVGSGQAVRSSVEAWVTRKKGGAS